VPEREAAMFQNHRERICQALLDPEFLDVIIDRFVKEDSMGHRYTKPQRQRDTETQRHRDMDTKLL
jgi:hypothetical protein